MANPTPGPEPRRNRNERERQALPPQTAAENGHDESPDPESALASLGIWRSEPAPRPARRVTLESDRLRAAAPRPESEAKPASAAELERLQVENEDLRSIVADLRALLDEASTKDAGTAGWAEREQEYERLLEEKSEVIRKLHLKAQELEAQAPPPAAPAAPAPPVQSERDLLELSDELDRERAQMEQERRQLQEERRQLKQDEEAMVNQMREMEMQMSRERAELARQRNELQRLHGEIRHELEAAQRDSLVNERLRMLQRRHQETQARRGEAPDQPAEAAKPSTPPPAPPKKDSGILRSLFGRRS